MAVGATGNRGFGELFGEAKGKLDNLQKDIAAILPSFPGMPVGKFDDLAIGVDVHSTVAPPSPSLPVPHVGKVFDIMGAIVAAIASELPTPEPPEVEMPEDGSDPPEPPMSLGDMACTLVKGMAPSVKVHGKWIANAGISIQHLPAIVIHAGPTTTPMASSEMWMGSSTVLCDGSPFSTQAHPALSCNLVGIPSLFRKGKPPKPKVSLMAPLSALLTITSVGKPVLAGGPPIIDLFQLLVNLGLKGIGKLWKKAKAKVKKPKTKTPDIEAPKKKTTPDNKANPNKKCKSEPIDVVTGAVFHENVDFELSGPIPLVWERIYYSNQENNGPLGYNWYFSYGIGIRETKEGDLHLRLADAREITVPQLNFGQSYYERNEQIDWLYDEKGYLMEDNTGLQYRFQTRKNRFGYYPLSEISTKDGFRIQFRYNGNGDLFQIIDSRNQRIDVDCDSEGRIRCVSVFIGGEEINLVRYKYDGEGNMVETLDALDVSKYFVYEGHLMTKLTNQSGLSFNWEYQGKGDKARCTHVWGDGGVLEYWFEYERRMTRTRNGLGFAEEYYYDEKNLIYKIIDANGGVTYQSYTEYEELELTVDPEGLSTKSAFNENGRIVKYTNENGESTHYAYDDHQNLIRVTTPGGVSMLWEYDELDRVVKRFSGDGNEIRYEYEGNLLKTITDDNGRRFTLEYNEKYDLTKLVYPNGLTREWEYDDRGRLTRSKDIKGNIARFRYDNVDNMIWMEEPDGNVHEFVYDKSRNLINAKDNLHEVAFTYGPMGILRSRTQKGQTIKFDYDVELQLRRIINEGGEQYQFELDGLGQVIKETGFDDLKREYIRDEAGRVVEVRRPDNRWTKYKYDGIGNVIKEEHYDETWTGYRYNTDGLLIEALNEEGNIVFNRDRTGRIVQEVQGGHTISRTYNRDGDCIQITSSLGADIRQEYDEEGNLIRLQSGDNWQADWKRDNTGLELHRQMTGGISVRTERDRFGREIRKTVGARNIEQSRKQYTWGMGDRLMSIQNELKSTHVNFDYDAFDNLIRADYQERDKIETIYRAPDVIGNLYETPSRTDRKYGKGGRLLEDPTYYYHYDVEGNLCFKEFKKQQGFSSIGKEAIEKKYKIRFKGSATGWLYDWSANGMLQKVVNPQQGKIRFGYDPLGRRIYKEYKNRRTNWLWDGNVPLHEWETHSTETLLNVVTWIFEGGFVPCAKVTQDNSYSIVTDYLGTPTQMFDKDGTNVWDAELDIYGKVRTFRGSSLKDCPFRYQGQYLDVETGLYYNRFRYYDPEVGNYISQDPIGLLGGMTLYSYVHDTNYWLDIFGLANMTPLGDAAEDHLRNVLNNNGWHVFSDIKNGSNQGLDVIAQHPVTKKIYVFEVKANSSRLTKLQRSPSYVMDRINEAADFGTINGRRVTPQVRAEAQRIRTEISVNGMKKFEIRYKVQKIGNKFVTTFKKLKLWH